MSAPPDAANTNKHTTSNDSEMSCFEILARFHARLYISCEKLLEHITLTQKDPKGQISWVEFNMSFHSHLVRITLVHFNKPPLPMAERAIFTYILEILNFNPVEAFFAQKSTTATASTPAPQDRVAKSVSNSSIVAKCIQYILLHNPVVFVVNLNRWRWRILAVQDCVRLSLRQDIHVEYIVYLPVGR